MFGAQILHEAFKQNVYLLLAEMMKIITELVHSRNAIVPLTKTFIT